jgi:hypothetical protein
MVKNQICLHSENLLALVKLVSNIVLTGAFSLKTDSNSPISLTTKGKNIKLYVRS